ncbi:Hypothetical protein I5071_70590 [Sandaracinus amylolyticus]|nr:Hypothetical protein I5071_70590 [Sandaracinus amylolyticus]
MVRGDPRADAIAIAVTDALRSRGERATLPPPIAPEPDEHEALEAAEREYQMLRPDAAAAQLEDVLARVDSTGAGLPRDARIDAWLLLAMARAALGDDAGAEAAVDRALAIDPALAPDPARYPPPLLARIDARRREGALVPLIVTTRDDATIELDGAPASRESTVAPGVHVVRARAPHHRAAARVVEIEGPTRIELALEIDPAAVLASDDASDELIVAAGRALGLEPVIVDLHLDRDALRLDAREGDRVAHARVSRDALPSAAADAIVASLRAPEVIVGDDFDPVPWIVGGSALAVGAVIAVVIGVVVGGGTPTSFDARGTIER